MLGCARCRQFGFLNLPFRNESFRRMLDRHHADCQSFHAIVSEWLFPRSGIRMCDCCGDGEDWYFEPGIHCTVGDCRPGESDSKIELILVRHQISPLYWEFLRTGDQRYNFNLGSGGSRYLEPGGTSWQRTIDELAALRVTVP